MCTSALWGAPRHAVVKIYIYIIIEVRTRCYEPRARTDGDARTGAYSTVQVHLDLPHPLRVGIYDRLYFIRGSWRPYSYTVGIAGHTRAAGCCACGVVLRVQAWRVLLGGVVGAARTGLRLPHRDRLVWCMNDRWCLVAPAAACRLSLIRRVVWYRLSRFASYSVTRIFYI